MTDYLRIVGGLVTVCLVCLPIWAGAQADRGSSTPWIRHTIDSSSRGADGLRLADANGDGRLDIATGWEEGGVVRVYLHPGEEAVESHWPRVTVGTVQNVEDAVFMDVDDDGTLDVVSATEGSTRRLFVHWAPAQERYLAADAWRTELIPAADSRMRWMFTLPARIDGRGGQDLFAAGKNESAEIGWLRSPEDPKDLDAWTWHSLSTAGWVMSLESMDMDADGDEDLLLTDRYGEMRGVRWLENPGFEVAATTSWNNHFIGGGSHQVMFMTVADLYADGRDDILTATRSDTLLYFQQPGDPGSSWPVESIILPSQTGTAKSVAVDDIDGDGRVDIVFSCERAEDKSGVMWMQRRDGTADEWIAHEISGPTGTKYDLVRLIDLDGDGDLDVLTCEEREGLGVIWYENPR
jgi:hypothetical protein